jgi:hypothetical protein
MALLAPSLVPEGVEQRKHGQAIYRLKEFLHLDTLDSFPEQLVAYGSGSRRFQLSDSLGNLRLQ